MGGPQLGPPWFKTAPESIMSGLPHNVVLDVFDLEAGGPDLLRSLLSVAILAQRSSRCLAVVSSMAMPKASTTAEVASATAERRFAAEMIQ